MSLFLFLHLLIWFHIISSLCSYRYIYIFRLFLLHLLFLFLSFLYTSLPSSHSADGSSSPPQRSDPHPSKKSDWGELAKTWYGDFWPRNDDDNDDDDNDDNDDDDDDYDDDNDDEMITTTTTTTMTAKMTTTMTMTTTKTMILDQRWRRRWRWWRSVNDAERIKSDKS